MVVTPAAFAWTDQGFSGHPTSDLVIYELHVGAFTRAGTFEAIVPHLPELVELGVTAIELMPVAEFPGSRNWGYDGVHLFAPQSTYGGPRGLRRLVDACHTHGLSVILDVVYNHLGPEGNYLGDFGPYFTDRYRTPWGGALNYDGPDGDGVRRHFIENTRAWVRDFHLDGLRLDAIHAIYDASPVHILTEITAAAREEARLQGRLAHIMAEEYGETAPFQFFTSFLDRDRAEAVRKGRTEEFSRFAWQGAVPDPGEPATFVRSRLNHPLVGAPRHRELYHYYRRWLALRRSHGALGTRGKERTRAVVDPKGTLLTLVRDTESGPGVRLFA